MGQNKNFFYFLLLLFCSCSKTFETSEEMADYLSDEENGYIYSKSVQGVDFVVKYRPTDLIVQQMMIGEKNDNRLIDSIRNIYSKYLYFNLSMSNNNQELLNKFVGDNSKFGGLVVDLSFNMDKKVHLYNLKKDTLEMANFIYPRLYGMTNSTEIMLVYLKDEKAIDCDYLNFVIEDMGMGTGDVKFKLNTASLKNEPKLIFK